MRGEYEPQLFQNSRGENLHLGTTDMDLQITEHQPVRNEVNRTVDRRS